MSFKEGGAKPIVFLSFAGEDLDWKRDLRQSTWWSTLTDVADVFDYDEEPTRITDLHGDLATLLQEAAAFIPILSEFYINKDSKVIEHEFLGAVERFADRPKLFRPIIIDRQAKEWWDRKQHPVFDQQKWLRERVTYFELMDNSGPAVLRGELRATYSRRIRHFAGTLASAIKTIGPQAGPARPLASSIIVLGHPRSSPAQYLNDAPTVVTARSDLISKIEARGAKVEMWEDGWSRANGQAGAERAVCLERIPNSLILPVGPDDALDASVSPEVTGNRLLHLASSNKRKVELSKLKITLWLPSDHKDHADAANFVQSFKSQPADANPRFSVASPGDLAALLVPNGAGRRITQISIQALDDIREIASGRTARKIVEEEVRSCVLEGARQAKLEVEPPPVRQFLQYQQLARQIMDAKDGRMVLVAHDLQEHPAANNADARSALGRKMRDLKEGVEGLIAPKFGQLIPITLVVSNFDNLRYESNLDEEIAGMKWRLLPGRLNRGEFEPEPDLYKNLVGEISQFLQQPGARP